MRPQGSESLSLRHNIINNLRENSTFGWIPRADLYDLFAGTTAFIYPFTFEGFGLPVVEALAAGIPTACSRIEPLSSMAGCAALQFDPREPPAILDAMVRITSDADLRARLSTEGPVRAKNFRGRRRHG